MRLKTSVAAVLIVLAAAGCTCVSPEQAVNVSEAHDGVVRLMPWAERGLKAELAVQSAIAADSSRAQTERDEAAKQATEITGRLLEVKILPSVTEPIRDWAIAKVGSEAYLKAKRERDAQITGGN